MKKVFLGVFATLLVIIFAAAYVGSQTKPTPSQVPSNVVISVKTDAAPVLDGKPEALWDKANAGTIPVSGGANAGKHEVTLKSVYTGDSVYFLAQWTDPTESLRRMPWQKQSNGSWKKLTTSASHQENTYYEDKFAMIWNINDSIAGFNQAGCMVTCHAGEKPANSGFGSKYTAKEGEMGDIWHWKGVRTDPVGQIDDQYVDSMRYDKNKAPEAGRHADPKTGGGYKNNETKDKKLPAFALKGNKPAPPYWVLDSEKVSFASAHYKAGDEVPGIIVSPLKGDRGDISGKGAYKNGKWTLEWGRKLKTGSKYDVQYTDLTKGYFFGVAIFDNAQVNHSWSNGAYELRFSK